MAVISSLTHGVTPLTVISAPQKNVLASPISNRHTPGASPVSITMGTSASVDMMLL
jgi:hypothetical protein